MSGLLDPNGATSSKRVAGFVLVGGILIIAIYAIYKDPSQAGNVIWPLVSLAGVCFGATALEKKK